MTTESTQRPGAKDAIPEADPAPARSPAAAAAAAAAAATVTATVTATTTVAAKVSAAAATAGGGQHHLVTERPALRSMTGYAAVAVDSPHGRVALELKSVNSRFLDLSFRTPDALRALESSARERIVERIRRGKLECRISLAPGAEQVSTLQVDELVLAQLANAIEQVRAIVPHTAPPSATELLRWPGVLQSTNPNTPNTADANADLNADLNAPSPLTAHCAAHQSADPPLEQVSPAAPSLQLTVMNLLERALQELDATREREAAQLSAVMRKQLQAMVAALSELRATAPERIAAQQQKLEERLREALIQTGSSVPLEQTMDRVRQEVAALGLRGDIAEELDRLGAHIDEAHRVIQVGTAAGKRLDFLAQEMNREANTIGSKSFALEQTRAAMALKLHIEQLREQVQNIE